MKFYSEKLDRLFDTQEELLAEEKATRSKSSKKKMVETPVEETSVPTKKQLAAEIDKATEAVKEAYANHAAAEAQVKELSKEYLAKVDSIMEPAKKQIQDAEKAKYEAIRKFNEAYGAYQVTYTGSRAAEEMAKALNRIDTKGLFKSLFWF